MEQKWIDRTEAFSYEQRCYKDTFMEKCDVLDDYVEVSIFSREHDIWEIFFQYGRMHGVIYFEESEVWERFEEIKEKMQKEYEVSGEEPSTEYVNAFGDTYDIDILNAFF